MNRNNTTVAESTPLGLLRSAITYTRVLKHFIGPRLYVFLVLNFLSVAAESIGLLLFIPFFKSLDMGTREADSISLATYEIFEWFGLELTISNTLILLTAAFCIKALVLFGINVYRQYVCSHLGFTLRQQLVKKYSTLTYTECAKRGTGFFGHMVVHEVGSTLVAISALSRAITGLITTSVFVLAVLIIHPQLSVITGLTGILSIYLVRFFSSLVQGYSTDSANESARLSGLIAELMYSIKYLKATGKFSSLRVLIERSNETSRAINLRHSAVTSAQAAIQEPLSVAILASLIYFFVVLQGQSFASIVVPLLFLYRCMQEVNFLQGNWMIVCDNSGAFTKVYHTLKEFERHQEHSTRAIPFQFEKEISFQEVDFAYGDNTVFRNLSVTIPKHSTTALVGASGAGKTTFIDLLTGILKPDSGTIQIDDTELSNCNLDAYRQKIGYVVQDPVLFSDSIANNISLRLGEPLDELSLQRVKKVAAICHVEEFVAPMKHGYETEVGERGYRLSGGQKQRIAIARELYKEPDILIFDESTSALDARSEAFIQESIANLRGSLTVLIISHRLATVQNVDRILVLEKGSIVESGTLDQLLAEPDSHFRKVYAQQAVGLASSA